MLAAVGVSTIDELFESIPEEVRFAGRLDLPEPAAEADVLRELTALAGRNRPVGELISFLGGGIYDTYVPAVVDAVTSRSASSTRTRARKSFNWSMLTNRWSSMFRSFPRSRYQFRHDLRETVKVWTARR